MRQDKAQYEKKIIQNKEFPIQILINKLDHLKEKNVIFTAHWHEHIELHYVIAGKMDMVNPRKRRLVYYQGTIRRRTFD